MVRKDKVSPRKYQIIGNKKYYFNRSDAERARKSGERIYFTKVLNYYKIKKKKNGFTF